MSAALAMPEPGGLRLVHTDPLGSLLDALATPTPAVMRDARRWLDHLAGLTHEAAVVALSPVTVPASRAREVAAGQDSLTQLLGLWATVDALPDASLAGLTASVPPRRYLARLVAAANAAAHALDLAANLTDLTMLTPPRAAADCKTMKAIKKIPVHGQEYEIEVDGDEARVRDLDIGARIGLAQPRNIRATIKAMEEKGKLPGIQTRMVSVRVARKGRGEVTMKVKEYWLTRAQALKVIAKCETEVADKILDEVIAIYEAAVDGRLDSATVSEILAKFNTLEITLAATRAEVIDLRGHLAQRTAGTPMNTIGRPKAAAFVKGPIRDIAHKQAVIEGEAWKKCWGRVQATLRDIVDFTGPWDMLPEDSLPKVHAYLTSLQKDVNRKLGMRLVTAKPKGEQLPIKAASN